jgi:hypothetical protein
LQRYKTFAKRENKMSHDALQATESRIGRDSSFITIVCLSNGHAQGMYFFEKKFGHIGNK